MHSANTRLFFLYHLRHVQKKKAPGPIFVFWQVKMGARALLRIPGAHFGWEGVLSVSIVLSVSVEGAMGVGCVSVEGAMGVGCVCVTCFLRCVFERHDAVCHLCAARGDRLSHFLDARPLGCHLVDGEKFLRGMNHARCETSCTVTPAIADRSEGVPFRFFFQKKRSFFSFFHVFIIFLFFQFFHFSCFFSFFRFFHSFVFFHFFRFLFSSAPTCAAPFHSAISSRRRGSAAWERGRRTAPRCAAGSPPAAPAALQAGRPHPRRQGRQCP